VTDPSDRLTDWSRDESYNVSMDYLFWQYKSRPPLAGTRDFQRGKGCVASGILIQDKPVYRHRSLLLGLGRRLYPISFVRSILDAISYAKLNVLHLYLSDNGRFVVESKI